eukprot:gene3749-6637_t
MCSNLKCTKYQDPPCSESVCNQGGRYMGFPIFQKSCIVPFDHDSTTGQKSCTGGQQKSVRCVKGYEQTQCTAFGGIFATIPTTEAERLKYKLCTINLTKVITTIPEKDCAGCGGNLDTAFKWVKGNWLDSVLYKSQKWIVAAEVPVNRWISGVDLTKFTNLVKSVVLLESLDVYKSMIQCSHIPLLSLTQKIACDCRTPKAPNGTACFESLKTSVATFKVFSGVTNKLTSTDADVTPSSSAVSVSNDYVEFMIIKTDLSTITTTQDKLIAFDSKATPTGYLASDGISVQTKSGTALSGKTNLCIKRKVEKIPSSYNSPRFATVSNGIITRTSVTITNNDYTIEMCGDITDTQTYYMTFF